MLLRNDLPVEQAHWIKLCLKGAAPNTMALGAQLTVKSGDLVQRCLVRTGSSYLSQSDCSLVFGLGDRRQVDSVEVRWQKGEPTVLASPAVNKAHLIEEPFGTDLDDLDLDGLCRTIAASVAQVLECEAEIVPSTVIDNDSLPRQEQE